MKRPEIEFEIRDASYIEAALEWADRMARKGLQSGKPVIVRLGRARRTLLQNAYLWAMCTDVARQVQWHGQWLSKDDWKDLFMGSWRGQDPIPGINGGVVFIGGGSSKLNKTQFAEVIEMIQAFGADHEVRWSGQSRDAIEYARSVREAQNA